MRYLLASAALVLASAAAAQQVIPVYQYPSQGTPPFMPLQCDVNYQNCKPYSAANPLPVAVVSGGGGGGGGGAVTVADGADTSEGATTSAAYTDATGTANGTVNGELKGLFVNTSGLFKAGQPIGNTGFNALGSAGTALQQGNAAAASANSANVYIGGQNAPLNVTSASTDNLTQISGSAITLGQKTMAASLPVTLASDGNYATAANQPGVATAGSAAPATGTMAMGVYNSTSPTLTTGQAGQLQITSAGGLKSNLVAADGNGISTNPGGSANNNGYTLASGDRILWVRSYNWLFNGTSSDKIGDANSTNATTGTGLLGAGVEIWDATSSLYRRMGSDTGTTNAGTAAVSQQASSSAGAGVAPGTSANATSLVLKASAGNLYSVNTVNSTVAGFLVILNATAAPTSGTAITPLYCMPVAASVGFRDTFNPPIYAATGITEGMSTSCTTYTPIGTAPVVLNGQAK